MSIKTTTLETSKLIREAGFRQDTEFYYLPDSPVYRPNTVWFKEQLDFKAMKNREIYAAPTTDELLEELPEIITLKGKGFGSSVETKCVLVMGKVNGEWRISYRNQIAHVNREDESLPEALAAMWLWLKKEGLL